MVAEEVFVNCYNFDLLLQSQKVIFAMCLSKTIWSRSRNSDFRLRGAGAERNIIGSRALYKTTNKDDGDGGHLGCLIWKVGGNRSQF